MSSLVMLPGRAGGGHNFGGGSHSSSSGSHFSGSGFSSGGSSGGGGIGGLIVLVILVIIVVIVVAMVKRKIKKGGGKLADLAAAAAAIKASMPTGPQAGMGAPAAPQANAVQTGLDAIRAHDPGFEDDKFVSDAERAFFTVQQAWTELKPDMSRRVMADNIWQQHKVQIEGYQSLNKRNVLEGLAIANARIIQAECDGAYDTIIIRLLAGCADYDIDMGNKNKVIRGNKDFTQWTEDWCFQRSSQATTKVGGGTMRQVCPNCGAPLDLDLQGVCKYCHAAVMSGQYDWVLTRIEQVNA